MKHFKVYNVNVWNIIWCDEHYIPMHKLPNVIENHEVSVYTDATNDEIIEATLSSLEEVYKSEVGRPVYIASAKIKISDWYFLANTFEGLD